MASSEARIVAVAGATGRQGGAAARALVAAGRNVRALTRHPDSGAAQRLLELGVRTVECDLGDRESVRRALKGTSQLYLTTTPYESGVEEEARQAKIVIDEARGAGVSHIVYSSVASADQPTGVAHFESKGRIEQYLKDAGIPTITILRPTFFMDMFLDEAFREAIARGCIRFALKPDTRIAMVAVEDIASFAVHAFSRPETFSGHVIELAGGYPTMAELASLLSAALQRDIEYQQIAERSLDPDVRPKAGTQRWLEDVGWHVDPGTLTRYGVPLTDLRAWAERHRAELLTTATSGNAHD